MKRILAATTILALTAGVAAADGGNKHRWGNDRNHGKYYGQSYGHNAGGRLTPHERVIIARNKARVNHIVRRARADGHVTWFERYRIKRAVANHRALVRKELRD